MKRELDLVTVTFSQSKQVIWKTKVKQPLTYVLELDINFRRFNRY